MVWLRAEIDWTQEQPNDTSSHHRAPALARKLTTATATAATNSNGSLPAPTPHFSPGSFENIIADILPTSGG